jgi:crotonobetainyl-CoA:carnitine CoA-transferase CaiB-like acyl-CoA transferase
MTPMLDGIKIVAFHHFLMGPLAVQFLADLGADVIAVEQTDGAFQRHWSGAESFVDGESMLFACANRNKRSIALNLRTDEGRLIASKLIAEANVVIENFRPGVMDRLGLSFEDAKKLRLDIIYASATGYGVDGPYRERAGQDLLLQALSGLAAATGRGEGDARAVGASVVDHHGAALLANGILAALVRHGRTGEGCRVEATLLGAAIDLQTEAIVAYLNSSAKPASIRQEEHVSGWMMQAPYGIYPASDGHIALSRVTLAGLAEALDCPPLAAIGEDELFSRKGEISRLVANHTIKFSLAELEARLAKHAFWFAVVNDYDQMARDPQVVAAGHIATVASANSGKKIRLTAHPLIYDGERPGVRLAPQPLGAQTEDILHELGYSPQQISGLIKTGTISVMPSRESAAE